MSHLRVLGARRVTRCELHTEDPLTLGATEKNVFTLPLRLKFVHPWSAATSCDVPMTKCRKFQFVPKFSVLLCRRINGFGRIAKKRTLIWSVKFTL